jgi:hypothetical protein
MARYVPDRTGIAEMMNSIMVHNAVRDHAEALLDLAKEEAPEVTGELKRSGHLEDTAGGVEVVFDAPHSATVHNGSKPHRIYAKPGGVLHWTDSAGNDHFAEHVDHPGTPPNPFLQRAVDIMTTTDGDI